ncbi:MAG: MFS transporter [bacterium]
MFKIKTYKFFFDSVNVFFYNCWAIALLRANHSLQDLAQALGIFFLTQSVLQVPTGIFADKYSRKLSIQIGLTLTIVGAFMMALTTYTWIGFLTIGVGFTFTEGAQAAWLREISNFEALGKSDTSFYFSLELIGRFATVTNALLGFFLSNKKPLYYWSFLILLCLISLFIVNIEKDTPLPSKNNKLKFNFESLKFSRSFIVFLFPTGIFYGLEWAIRNLNFQPYVDNFAKEANNPWIFGYFFAILSASRMLGNLTYKRLPSKVKNNFPLLLFFTLSIFGLSEIHAGYATNFWSFIAFYAGAVFFLGIFFPIRETLLNRIIPPNLRATALSLDSMVTFGVAAAFLLLFSQKGSININQLWIVSGVSLVLAGIGFAASAKISERQKI